MQYCDLPQDPTQWLSPSIAYWVIEWVIHVVTAVRRELSIRNVSMGKRLPYIVLTGNAADLFFAVQSVFELKYLLKVDKILWKDATGCYELKNHKFSEDERLELLKSFA